MKKSIFTLSAMTIAVALTAGFTACSNDDILMEEEQTNGKVHTYSVSIPANFGEEGTRAVELGTGDKEGYLVSTFKTTDIISVLNKSKNKQQSSVNLTPASEGNNVDLTGDLSFTTDPEVGDVLLLAYNSDDKDYNYYSQKGSLAGLSDFDFATAEVTITSITGSTITTSPANFVNAQSMYKFTFTGLPDGVGVKNVTIWSTKKNLYASISYTSTYQTVSNDLSISLDNNARTANGQGVVYAALKFKPLSAGATEDIAFVVGGTNGKYYLGVKPSPAGGFLNGKYYTSTIALQPAVAPTLERYDGGPTSEFTPTDNMFRFFAHYDTFTSHNISISGDSYGYKFTMWDPIDGDEVGHSIVTLKGNGTATCLTTDIFLTCFMNMTFVLDGDYTINCPYNRTAIGINGGGSLKLSGNGTLTVTVNSASTTGISAKNYNGTQDASVLAEDGYTVTRSARTDNADGTYTWAYTVRPTNITLADVLSCDVGKVIGANGNIYADATAATAAGTSAVAMIAYVGSDNGEAAPYNHGLALAMSDAGNGEDLKWKVSSTDAGHTKQTDSDNFSSESGLQYNATHNTDDYPAFKAAIANNSTAAPTGCSAWFLASGYQWSKMFTAAGGYDNLKSTAVLNKHGYWSSSEYNAYNAWRFNSGYGSWSQLNKTNTYKVRSCLAF